MSRREPKEVRLLPGFKGFVTGVANSKARQRAFIEVKDDDGRLLTSLTFEGEGAREPIPLVDVFSTKPYWSFGPFNFSPVLTITISSLQRGRWVVSKMSGPLSVYKDPEPHYPMAFQISTVISEDWIDNSFDDCTIKVLQYKEPEYSQT